MFDNDTPAMVVVKGLKNITINIYILWHGLLDENSAGDYKSAAAPPVAWKARAR